MQQKAISRFCLSCFIGFLVCIGGHFLESPPIAKATEPSYPLFNQANITKASQPEDAAFVHYSSGEYQEAIKLWSQALTQTSDKKVKATIHTNLGGSIQFWQ